MLFPPLRNRQIIVAGGAGGIGQVIVESLLAEEADVIVSYRANARGAETFRNRATVVQADLTVQEDRARLLNAAPALYGLVVLAGDPVRMPTDSPPEVAFRQSHENNYLGPLLLAREAAEKMRYAKQSGAIVLFATMQAVAPFANSSAYAGAKAALAHAAKILALEMRAEPQIRVNVVSPGITDAGMAKASIASGKYDRYLDDQTVPRFGRPEDLARAVRFFLEPDNYITGQLLSVDGGITI
jgi:NAD(P)-dependent dehydrogenase (short-subunit alcohol dehydrogenase family)